MVQNYDFQVLCGSLLVRKNRPQLGQQPQLIATTKIEIVARIYDSDIGSQTEIYNNTNNKPQNLTKYVLTRGNLTNEETFLF